MIRDEIAARMPAAGGTTSVSFVYPTRDRPEFIREALAILAMQHGGDFEVIISDNYSDPALACEEACRDSGVRYIHPPRPLSMAENWEYPLSFTTGEYVAYLTDKMFVLPDALRRIEEAAGPEIINWVADTYQPIRYPDYFGDGTYYRATPGGGPFAPAEALDRRGVAAVSRHEQSAADYCRGKIVFGAYRCDLIARIVRRFGALFHAPGWGTTALSPDYTSMILGLSEARSAVELDASCVVQVNTDISGGWLIDTDDTVARKAAKNLVGLPVPGLYASQHNIVASDYVSLKQRFGLTFDFDVANWLVYCYEDIYRPSRRWSEPRVQTEQKGLITSFIGSLDSAVAATVHSRIAQRTVAA